MEPLKILALFIVTALAEIVGCYLPYLWLKQGKSAWLLIPAAASLALFAWLLSLLRVSKGCSIAHGHDVPLEARSGQAGLFGSDVRRSAWLRPSDAVNSAHCRMPDIVFRMDVDAGGRQVGMPQRVSRMADVCCVGEARPGGVPHPVRGRRLELVRLRLATAFVAPTS